MTSAIEALLELLGRWLAVTLREEAGDEPEGAAVPDWAVHLPTSQRKRLAEALLAVARCDGRLSTPELKLVQASFPVMEPGPVMFHGALAAVAHVKTPEAALEHVRECAAELPAPARRFALDAAAAILSLGDGVHRRLVPRFAEALGLEAAEGERALADNIVFLRPTPRGRLPYR